MISIDTYFADNYIPHTKVESHKDVSLPCISSSNVIHLHKWKEKQNNNLYTPTCI